MSGENVQHEFKIGDKLYYSDGEYFGEVVKVLKRDLHVKQPKGNIRKNWQKSLALKMTKKHVAANLPDGDY